MEAQLTLKQRKPATPQLSPDMTPEDLYSQWSKQPTPESGRLLLSSLDKDIKAAAMKWSNDTSPVTLGRAKSLLVDALPRYQPEKGQLSTFVNSQLQPLQRWKAKKEVGIRVPLQQVRDYTQLQQLSGQLEDELGRSPSYRELADKSGISLERITKAKAQQYPQIAEREVANSEEYQELGDQGVAANSDLWQKAVYHSLPPVDQVIFQHTLGLYGAEVMSNQAIAKKLRVTPGAISQRKLKIQRLLDNAMQES